MWSERHDLHLEGKKGDSAEKGASASGRKYLSSYDGILYKGEPRRIE